MNMATVKPSLKTAVVGLRIHAGDLDPDGNHGLLKSFKAQADVDVVAYCEWDRSEAAALEAIRRADPEAGIHTDLSALLAGVEFDAALVMLPPAEAAPAALRLAGAGKHLYIEKQAARTAAELDPLCRVAADRGLVIQAGYPWVCHPVAREIKRQIDAGVLGDLAAMEARLVTLQVGPGMRDPEHWMYTRAGEGGGILHMEGGHWLTLFHYFSGARVKSVTALCGRAIGAIEEGLEDVATVALEFDNGVHACLHMGYLLPGVGPGNDTCFSLRGTLGAATWPSPGDGEFTVASALPAWQGAPVRTFRMEVAPRPVYADEWGYQFVAAFVRAVRENGRPLVSAEDARRVLQTIDAAYESSRTGRRVQLS